jgi:hypothetical protein
LELPTSFDDGRVRFDAEVADRIVGKVVLITITYEDFRGNIKGTDQIFGTVTTVDPKFGISVALSGVRAGTVYKLPPSTESFTLAPKGEYRLRGTGEVVVDPDYTTEWRAVQRDA